MLAACRPGGCAVVDSSEPTRLVSAASASSSTSVSTLIISHATISRAGAVACGGTIPISGAMNMNGKKSAPVTTLTQPVLPPTATPEEGLDARCRRRRTAPRAAAAREPTAAACGSRASASCSCPRSPLGDRPRPACPSCSKKVGEKSENANASAAMNGSVEKASKLNSPTRLKSGDSKMSSGQRVAGACRRPWRS